MPLRLADTKGRLDRAGGDPLALRQHAENDRAGPPGYGPTTRSGGHPEVPPERRAGDFGTDGGGAHDVLELADVPVPRVAKQPRLRRRRQRLVREVPLEEHRRERRTIFVELGHLRPFSDLAGRHVIHFDASIRRRQELAERLRAAGCAVDTAGTDWHDAGDFDAPVRD